MLGVRVNDQHLDLCVNSCWVLPELPAASVEIPVPFQAWCAICVPVVLFSHKPPVTEPKPAASSLLYLHKPASSSTARKKKNMQLISLPLKQPDWKSIGVWLSLFKQSDTLIYGQQIRSFTGVTLLHYFCTCMMHAYLVLYLSFFQNTIYWLITHIYK